MKVEQLLIEGKKFIKQNEANQLLATVLGYNTLELLNHFDEEVTPDNEKKYKKYIEELLDNKPLQYIIGNVNFYGYEFDINEKVLIPRFETEELVFNVINFIKKNLKGHLKVIDLGCGSGVIGITLSKEIPELEVTCLDISEEALEVTKENAKKLGANIRIQKGDMLDNINEKFDVIVSNPPYIATNEEIESLVKDNEPHIALYAGDDGLDYYRKIFDKVGSVIKDNFLIALEIGCTQKNDIIKIINDKMKNVKIETLKDMSSKDRIIFVYRNN
ncbi:MAG: peptide chain release factor N(5)-glutamine methyltransferase [Bacilli bacterium]